MERQVEFNDTTNQQDMEEENWVVLEDEQEEELNFPSSEENDVDEEEIEDEEGLIEPVDQSQDEKEGYFTYRLENFNRLGPEKVLSPWRKLGDYKFRFLIFPKGNGAPHDLSLYLETAPLSKRGVPFLSQALKFCLILVNVKNPQMNIAKYADHKFTTAERDWGFREFAKLNVISNPSEGFLEHGALLFTAQVTLVSEWELENAVVDYDSRKATGYVGLKNQGATCYMNSLLQTLFHLGEFRIAVYRMPLVDNSKDNSPDLLTHALQRVFYDLQDCPTVVKTKRLTDSFGWDNADAFTQHDVQELNRILCDALEEKMAKDGDDGQNTIQRLFKGKILNYIKCIHVPYESTHVESFYDLSLNVRGCADIYESFEKYLEVEVMDGDNKYRAEGYSELQAAKKGSAFLMLPPVLQLHLKRFEYDFVHDMMVKINDHYKFYETIDLNAYVSREYAMESSNVDYTYELHSVLVHMGDIHGGHYYVFIRPDIVDNPDKWYKFDDDVVLKVDKQAVIEDNFGVGGQNVSPEEEEIQEERDRKLRTLNGLTPPELQPPKSRQSMVRRFANAYMLQYVRKDKVKEYLSPISDDEVPSALKERLEMEKQDEALRKKERLESHLYCTFMILTENDLLQYGGTDLLPRSALFKLKMRKSTLLKELKETLYSKNLINDPSLTRIWRCFQRDNDTIRTQWLLAGGRDESSVLEVPDADDEKNKGSCQVVDESVVPIFVEDLLLNDGRSERIRALFLEVSINPATPALAPDELILFFKWYSPLPSANYRVIGKQIMQQNDTIANVLAVIKEMIGNSFKDPVLLFEEISPKNVQKLDVLHRTLSSYKIGNGDIIVAQPVPPSPEDEQVQQVISCGGRYLATVVDFFDYLMKRVDIEIRNILEPQKPGLTLDVTITDSYKDMCYRFCKLSQPCLDPNYIRFYPFDTYHMQSRSFSLLPKERNENFGEFIRSYAIRPPHTRILYYQRLAYPATQYDETDEYTVIYREDRGLSWKEEENLSVIQESSFCIASDATKEQHVAEEQSSSLARTNIFSILLPHKSKVSNLLQRVREVLNLSETCCLRLLLVKDHRIVRWCFPEDDMPESHPQAGFLLRVEPCEADESDIQGEEEYVYVSVFHFTKDYKQLGGYDTFGVPFLFKVPPSGISIPLLKKRLATALKIKEGVDSWKLHEVQGHTMYCLENLSESWQPHPMKENGLYSVFLGIERKNNFKRHVSFRALGDKPLKIRG